MKGAATQMGRIEIDKERCKGCGLCVDACPKEKLRLSEKINAMSYHYAVFEDADGECTGCTNCAVICPDIAIKVYR